MPYPVPPPDLPPLVRDVASPKQTATDRGAATPIAPVPAAVAPNAGAPSTAIAPLAPPASGSSTPPPSHASRSSLDPAPNSGGQAAPPSRPTPPATTPIGTARTGTARTGTTPTGSPRTLLPGAAIAPPPDPDIAAIQREIMAPRLAAPQPPGGIGDRLVGLGTGDRAVVPASLGQFQHHPAPGSAHLLGGPTRLFGVLAGQGTSQGTSTDRPAASSPRARTATAGDRAPGMAVDRDRAGTTPRSGRGSAIPTSIRIGEPRAQGNNRTLEGNTVEGNTVEGNTVDDSVDGGDPFPLVPPLPGTLPDNSPSPTGDDPAPVDLPPPRPPRDRDPLAPIPPSDHRRDGNTPPDPEATSEDPDATPTPTDAAPDPDAALDPDAEPNADLETDPGAEPDPTPGTAEGAPPLPPPPNLPPGVAGAIELVSDQQIYSEQRQVLTAIGNVTLRYLDALIEADRVQINLATRIAVAEGNVDFTRGDQFIQGDRLEYNLIQGNGRVYEAYGEVYRPTAGEDFAPYPMAVVGDYNPALDRPLSDRISEREPLSQVRQAGQFGFRVGLGTFDFVSPETGTDEVQNIRFQASRIDFDPNGWVADNVRLTNDPFNPPELEIRTEQARLRRLSPLRDELTGRNPRIVIDDHLSLPLWTSRLILDRRERPPRPFEILYDQEDRGGLYIQRRFRPVQTPSLQITLTPQYYVQKAISNGIIGPDLFGLKARLVAALSPSTAFVAMGSLTSFDFEEIEDNFRGSTRLSQAIPTPWGSHDLTLEASYRDRIFNGSLGFRTVQRSFGAVLSSPPINLWNSGVILRYQAGYQNIEANTDRLDLLDPIRDNDRIELNRFQAAASLTKSFMLWQGEALPATAEAGLRYSPVPVRPFLQFITQAQGVVADYSNGESQDTLSLTAGLAGQFGHFSRDWFDSTGFNLFYIHRFRNGESPFLFDRVADDRILAAGITQQIYGPFRIGIQTSYNLDTDDRIDADFTFEYSRRTHGLLFRFNPERELGSVTLRITDFDWTGRGEIFQPPQ